MVYFLPLVMRNSLLFIIVLSAFVGHTQLVFEKTNHSFGNLESFSDRFVDILVKNTGTKKEYLLSVKKPYDVVYLVNGQFIEKDSVLTIRLQVNPKEKGKFSYEVEVYASDRQEPVKIKLTGNVVDLPREYSNVFTQCPDFSRRPSASDLNFQLTVITIDKETKKVIGNTKVNALQNGTLSWAKSTDRGGKINKQSGIGFYYFYATHEGYYSAELGMYVNHQRNQVVVELERDLRITTPVPSVDTAQLSTTPPAEIAQTELKIDLEESLKKEVATESVPSTDTLHLDFTRLDPNDFSIAHFKPVNVVFVLDVSSSMKLSDKLELMKYSLIQLVEMLRREDKIALVTYSTAPKLLLKSTSGMEKETINEQVKSLLAMGSTAGGEGIKMGYKEALKNFIPDGKNMVVVITDGAFNSRSDYKKHIEKYTAQGIQLSVVGIKTVPKDEVQMSEVATLGSGKFIPIHKLSQAQNNLKQEIRALSFRK
jgi:Ca-activated chloride channel family protein